MFEEELKYWLQMRVVRLFTNEDGDEVRVFRGWHSNGLCYEWHSWHGPGDEWYKIYQTEPTEVSDGKYDPFDYDDIDDERAKG